MMYRCDGCGRVYAEAGDREACAARGVPPKLPAGTIFTPGGLRTPAAYIVGTTETAGHDLTIKAWSLADGGPDPILSASPDRLWEGGLSETERANPASILVQRAARWARARGLVPHFWDGTRAVELTKDGVPE